MVALLGLGTHSLQLSKSIYVPVPEYLQFTSKNIGKSSIFFCLLFHPFTGRVGITPPRPQCSQSLQFKWDFLISPGSFIGACEAAWGNSLKAGQASAVYPQHPWLESLKRNKSPQTRSQVGRCFPPSQQLGVSHNYHPLLPPSADEKFRHGPPWCLPLAELSPVCL